MQQELINNEDINVTFVELNLKTDFEKIIELFKLFFHKEPTWAAVVETDLASAAPTINEIVLLIGGPAADIPVAATIASIQMWLIISTKLIQVLDNGPSFIAALNTLLSNLKGLLSLDAIKNHPMNVQITERVNKISTEIQIILTTNPKTSLRQI